MNCSWLPIRLCRILSLAVTACVIVGLSWGCLSDPADVAPDDDAGDSDAGDLDAGGDADTGDDAEVGDDADACEPIEDCEEMEVECGSASDGCGGLVDCGDCDDSSSDPKVCDAGQCVCDPGPDFEYCDDDECGVKEVVDDCEETREVDCGGCSPPYSCVQEEDDDVAEDITEAGQCECVPEECGDDDCGDLDDGCGGIRECGECDVDVCEPLSCEEENSECGQISNECGDTKRCGDCDDEHRSCLDNECVCDISPVEKAEICDDAGLEECGEVKPESGCEVDCGECNTGCSCEDGECVITNPIGGTVCTVAGGR